MRQSRLLILSIFATLAFGALTAVAASAESVDGPPKILILTGKVSELEFTDTGEASTLESLGGKAIQSTKEELSGKEFLELEKSFIDTNLWIGIVRLSGVKMGAVGCRSETAKGEKDPIETVLAILDMHLADEKSNTFEPKLEPIVIIRALGVAHEEEVIINCGGIKGKAKGRIPCLLLPGLVQLAAGVNHEILCKQSKGVQETGLCEETPTLCKELKEDPYLVNFGAGFEDVGVLLHLLGAFNKDIFIDD